MNHTREYSPEIDLLKFVFALSVVLHHGGKVFGLTPFAKGYLAVEFFLLVSGYFMDKSLRVSDSPSSSRFLFRKISSVYAVAVASTAIAFSVKMAVSRASVGKIATSLIASAWEFLLVREAGLRIGPEYNGPLWYISSMLLSMAVLYPLFRRLRDSGLLPLSAILFSFVCYASIWHECGCLVAGDRWAGFCTWRTIRAAGGISLGVFLGEAVALARNSLRVKNAGKHFFRICLVILLAGLAVLLAASNSRLSSESMDFLVLPVLFALLFLVLSGWTGFHFRNPERFQWFGTASLYIYLNHAAVLVLLRTWTGVTPWTIYCLLFAGTAIASCLCAFFVRLLRTAVRRVVPQLVEIKP